MIRVGPYWLPLAAAVAAVVAVFDVLAVVVAVAVMAAVLVVAGVRPATLAVLLFRLGGTAVVVVFRMPFLFTAAAVVTAVLGVVLHAVFVFHVAGAVFGWLTALALSAMRTLAPADVELGVATVLADEAGLRFGLRALALAGRFERALVAAGTAEPVRLALADPGPEFRRHLAERPVLGALGQVAEFEALGDRLGELARAAELLDQREQFAAAEAVDHLLGHHPAGVERRRLGRFLGSLLLLLLPAGALDDGP